MITFRALASSSSGCCYLVKSGSGRPPILIDPGLPIAKIKEQVQVTKLGFALVSHHHLDHCRGAYALGAAGIPIVASAEALIAMRLGKEAARHRFWDLRALSLVDNIQTRIDGWDVLGFNVKHDAPGSMGFLVSDGSGETLYYLTDSGYSPVVPHRPTVVAIEANHDPVIIKDRMLADNVDRARWERTRRGHMSIDETVRTLQAMDLSECRAMHLLHLSDSHSDEDQFAERVRQATGVPTYVAAKRSA